MTLSRKTPLKTSTPPLRMSAKRRAALAAAGVPHPGSTLAAVGRRPAARRRPADTNPPEATVGLVWERDCECCTCCGRGLHPAGRGEYWSVHHRVLRSQGVNNCPSNLILLCGGAYADGCHRLVHARQGRYRREGGWILGRADNPAAYPVLHATHGLVFLTPAGGWTRTLAGTA